MMDTYCVIMAGGVGSRFWPKSRSNKPKQFLDFLGTGQTLIQQTYERFSKFCKPENFYVVTSEEYRELVHEQLPKLSPDQVLCEPMMRNTAPCIAYAAYKIGAKTKEANIIVTPSDHLILKQDAFEHVIFKALHHAGEYPHIVTLGIDPTRPDTGYGYIESDLNAETFGKIEKVKQFREKPDRLIAEEFVEAGNFTWNSGMFIWSLGTLLNSFQEHAPQIATLFQSGNGIYRTEKEKDFIAQIYPKCDSISVDYAILEKANNVFVLRADIGWSDLGTWGSIYNHLEQDKSGNAILGKNVIARESSGCVIDVPDDMVVTAIGVKDLIIVESDGVLIVVNRDNEQQIKKVRQRVGDKFGKNWI